MFCFAFQVILGAAYLFTVPAPQSLAAIMPHWLVMTWAAAMVLSGAAGLIGSWWRGSPSSALELERGALLMSTGALALIGGASFVVNGWRAAFGGGLIVAWAAANLVRCWQIRTDVKKITTAESGYQ